MKKFLASLLAALTIVASVASIGVRADAKETTKTSVEKAPIVKPKHMTKVEVNEYELYKKLKKESNEALLKDGWSIQKIEEFRKYDYVETLKERAKLPKDELKQMGYSDEKINILKNNDSWSESQLMALSSTLMLQGGVSYTESNNRIWNFYYEWSWDTNPGFTQYEVLGARWIGSTNGTTAVPTLSYSIFYVNMIDLDAGYQQIFANMDNMDKVDLNAGELQFRGYEMMSGHRTFAMSGYGYLKLDNSTSMERVTMSIKYGHTTSSFAIDPSISLTGADVGFTFTNGTSEAASILETYRPDGTIVE